MVKMLLIGNSHLAAFYRALEREKGFLEKCEPTIVQANFLNPRGLDYEGSSGFQKFELVFPNGVQKTVDLSGEGTVDHLVLIGLDLFGDGIIRCHGNLVGEPKCQFPEIYEFDEGSGNSPKEAISSACLEYLYYSNICKALKKLKSAKESRNFKAVTWVCAPDITERCARTIFGSSFVNSGRYSLYKQVYTGCFDRACQDMGLDNDLFISHPDFLLSESGFSSSEYADLTKNQRDSHVTEEYFSNAVFELSRRFAH